MQPAAFEAPDDAMERGAESALPLADDGPLPSGDEIAAQLDIPLGTVKSRLRLAMARLKRIMGEAS